MSVISILLFIILALTVVFSISMLWPLIIGAAWSPASKKVVIKMLEMAEVSQNDVVYDLGSGDGRIVLEAAKRYHVSAVGIEADPLRVLWSKTLVKIRRENLVKIIWGNIFNADLRPASVVTIFLWQRTNEKLKEKLLEELEPGTRIVSYVWKFNGWKPVKVDKKDRIYMYIIGKSDVQEDYLIEDLEPLDIIKKSSE